MENASKALIVAGGVLIAVLVVSISVYLLNGYREFYYNSMNTLSSTRINAFNTDFNKYGNGVKISGADAFNILSRVSEINSSDLDDFVVDSVATTGTVTVDNYMTYFYFAENLLKEFNYSFGYNDRGIINSVSIIAG